MISFLKKQYQNLMQGIELKKKKYETKKRNQIMTEEYIKNLVAENNLIQEKKSKLSKNQRDIVQAKVKYLIQTGRLQIKR